MAAVRFPATTFQSTSVLERTVTNQGILLNWELISGPIYDATSALQSPPLKQRNASVRVRWGPNVKIRDKRVANGGKSKRS